MKKMLLFLITALLIGGSQVYSQYITAQDNAGNYAIWEDGNNEGVGFGDWDMWNDGTAGTFLGSSHGNLIDTDGRAFGMWGNPGYANAARFVHEPLNPGQSFSMELSVHWRDGARGIDVLNSEFETLYNFNISNAVYGDTGWGWVDNSAIRLTITQTETNSFTVSAFRLNDEAIWTSTSQTGVVAGFKAYVGDTGGGGERNFYINNLKVETSDPSAVPATADVIINGHVELGPSETLTVNNLTVPGGNSLTIKSDATGTGSLIHNNADVTATIERYIPAPTTGSWDAGYGWHLLSAPVTGQDISDFTVETATDYDFYLWDEATDHWINYKDETTTWGDFNTDNEGTTHSTDFARGRGYLVAYAAEQTGFKYERPVNVADVTWNNLSFDGSGSGAVYSKGWHLLGNPFASALTWNVGSWALSNVAGTAKIWNEETRAYIDVTSAGTHEHIPAAQGFFVQVESGDNSITIPADARVHQPDKWYKNQQATGVFLAAREAEKAGGQEKNILITEGASEGFDFYRDSRFMAGYAPQLFSIFGDEKLSTKQLPAIDEETVIQLGFIKNTVKDFVIELDVARLYPGLEVYLVDKKLGIDVYLNEKPSYAFISEEDDAMNRFELHFSPPQDDDPTNIEDVDAPSVKLWYSNNTLYVNSHEHNTAVEVYDISGRRLQSHTMAAGEHRIELNLPAGVYLVQSSGNSHHETMKIIIQ